MERTEVSQDCKPLMAGSSFIYVCVCMYICIYICVRLYIAPNIEASINY